MPYLWNDGLGFHDLPADLEIQALFILEGQEIQYWQGLVLNSTTLNHYNLAKPSFGEEINFKFNLPVMILCQWIQLSGTMKNRSTLPIPRSACQYYVKTDNRISEFENVCILVCFSLNLIRERRLKDIISKRKNGRKKEIS